MLLPVNAGLKTGTAGPFWDRRGYVWGADLSKTGHESKLFMRDLAIIEEYADSRRPLQLLNGYYRAFKPMISIVVPVLNEESNVGPLLEEIHEAAASLPLTEVIFVDDASTDRTLSILRDLKAAFPRLRVLRHARISGQSAALWTGIKAARGEIVITLDGDRQNDPADMKRLFDLYQNQTQAAPNRKILVAGQRARRNDNALRRFSSRIANRVRSSLLKDRTRDTGCALKLFRRDDYIDLPYFDHMHRFLPALFLRDQGLVLHVDVDHRARVAGASKYGMLNRVFVGIVDLWGVRWLQSRARRVFDAVEQ